MKLLYTERPVLLERERETHDWMFRERPWERFGLELVYDNRPGGWVRYAETFRRVWEECRGAGTGFINVESDVVPTIAAFEAVLGCPQPVCSVPYEYRINHAGAISHKWGGVIEERVPGGWYAHFPNEGDEWAVDEDLGFVRFGPAACARPLPEATRLAVQNGLLNREVFLMFRSTDPRDWKGRIHLHWPGLRNNHLFWDEGDQAHWEPSEWARLREVHRDYLPPET